MIRVKRLLRYGLGAAILLLLAFVLAVVAGVFGKLPSKDELAAIRQAEASLVYSSDGRLIGKFFSQNRTNIAFDQLPEHLVQALVATEDSRFWEHGGIDFRSLLRVLFKSVLGGDRSAGGGSTLSQQLAKNLYGRQAYGRLSMPVAKLREMIIASRLEQVYAKQELIELYLNTVPFGEDVYGIEAAALRYFGSSAAHISLEEAASLVGMLKANTAYNPRLYPENALNRRNVVLAQMEKAGYLSPEARTAAAQTPLGLRYSHPETDGPAPYFLQQLKREAVQILERLAIDSGRSYELETSGLRISSTLHAGLQEEALQAFEKQLSRMQSLLDAEYRREHKRKQLENIARRQLKLAGLAEEELRKRWLFSWEGNKLQEMSNLDSAMHQLRLLQAGFIGVDPHTGAIRCWVGGIDFGLQAYDQVLARRQLASVVKPLWFAAALEEQWSPCQYLSNDTAELRYGQWRPANYDQRTGPPVSMAAALRQSLNLPAVHLYRQLGQAPLANLWEACGFSRQLPDGPAVALGSAEASIYELAVAYAALANGGYRIGLQSIESIHTAEGKLLYQRRNPEPERLLSVQTSDYISQMLQQVVDSGTAAAMRHRYGVRLPLAGKTGSSQDYADAWFASYNPKLLLIGRVGCALPQVHFSSGQQGSGSALAMPLSALVWREIEKHPALRKEFAASFSFTHPLPLCSDTLQRDWLYDLGTFFGADKEKQAKRTERRAEKRETRRVKRKEKIRKWFGGD